MKRPVSNRTPTAAPAGAANRSAARALRKEQGVSTKFARLGAAALETLLDAIDANDPVTGAHVRRVARYSMVIADCMGVDSHTCFTVERVALFHDIGKIHEALFDVMHDPHKLNPRERRAVQTHPARGAKVLEPLTSFYPDLPKGVIAHHERWDGSGYPRGLRKTAIPLSARIVAIADTFDAVTHARRYSHGRSFTAGMEVIGEGRGTQFDPEIVDLFLSPPVQARIRSEMRGARAAEASHHGRRHSRASEKVDAPDVSFRWRDTSPD